MKKLSKIKLNQFSKDELARRKLNALKGGCECSTSGCTNCTGQCDCNDWLSGGLISANLSTAVRNSNVGLSEY